MSFHLTPVGDLKRKRSTFNIHSFCICTISYSLEKESSIVNEMASSFSSASSNCPKNDSTSSTNDSSSSNTSNAPPSSPELVPFPSPLPFPIFPLPPQVFLLQEVQPCEGSEEDEGEDFKELQLKAEEDEA